MTGPTGGSERRGSVKHYVDGKAAIPRTSIVLLDKKANAPYFPSSWGGRSWLDRDDEAEQIKFNKEKAIGPANSSPAGPGRWY